MNSSFISPTKEPNFNLAMFEEVLRRCVYRQKRAFLVYETLIGFTLILFVLSTGNCLLNLGLCWSGLDGIVKPVLPVFLWERDSPPATTSLSLLVPKVLRRETYPSSTKSPGEKKSNADDEEGSSFDDDGESLNNEEHQLSKNRQNYGKAKGEEKRDESSSSSTSKFSKERKISNNNNNNQGPISEQNVVSGNQFCFLCFNQPINIFWVLGLRLDLICVMSFVSSISLFLIVRGVFALRRPDSYLKGLNVSLKREYGWRFDEKVGKLIVLPK